MSHAPKWDVFLEKIDALAIIAEASGQKQMKISNRENSLLMDPDTVRRLVRLARKGIEAEQNDL